MATQPVSEERKAVIKQAWVACLAGLLIAGGYLAVDTYRDKESSAFIAVCIWLGVSAIVVIATAWWVRKQLRLLRDGIETQARVVDTGIVQKKMSSQLVVIEYEFEGEVYRAKKTGRDTDAIGDVLRVRVNPERPGDCVLAYRPPGQNKP